MAVVRQVFVFLENKTGRLAEATRVLHTTGVNIGALTIADASDFGILRFLCEDPDGAAEALRAAGFSVGETEVLAVQVADRPGGLAEILGTLRERSINVDYLYAFRGRAAEAATIVLHVETGREQEAVAALTETGHTLLSQEQACEC